MPSYVKFFASHCNALQIKTGDRRSGMSLTQVARKHAISRASLCRLMKELGAAAPPSVHPEMFDSVAANI